MRTRLIFSITATAAITFGFGTQSGVAAYLPDVGTTTYDGAQAANVAQQIYSAEAESVELARHGRHYGHYRGPYIHHGFRGHYYGHPRPVHYGPPRPAHYGPPRPAHYGPPRPAHYGPAYRAYRPPYFPSTPVRGYGGGGHGCGYRGGGFGLYIGF